MQDNQKTIIKELLTSLTAFASGDGVGEVINLENKYVPGVLPLGIDHSEALHEEAAGADGKPAKNKAIEGCLNLSLATPFSQSTSFCSPMELNAAI